MDVGTSMAAPLLIIGEKLGLFKAMMKAGPLTWAEVADRAGTSERYTREWLRGQAAGGYVTYDADTDRLIAMIGRIAADTRRLVPSDDRGKLSAGLGFSTQHSEPATRGGEDRERGGDREG